MSLRGGYVDFYTFMLFPNNACRPPVRGRASRARQANVCGSDFPWPAVVEGSLWRFGRVQ
jgi:hypothetical protein